MRATLSTYDPTAYALASASSQRLRWRRTSGGLSTAGGTTEKKLSFCLLGESGPDSASDEVYLHTTQQNVLVRLNGSDGKFQIRFGQGGTQPVIVNSVNTYNTAGLKWAIFGAWDCTAGTSSKVRVYIVTVSGGALSVETVSNTDALAHTSFSGTNLGGDAYIFLGSTNGGASYANGKLGGLWWVADFIDWSNSAYRDVLVEKSAADVLQAKQIDTAAASNAAVNSISPEIWLALNANEQLGSPYNRGSLGVANVLTYVDNAPSFGAWDMTTYWLDFTTGGGTDDGGDGSQGNPFKSPYAARTAMATGGNVFMGKGRYVRLKSGSGRLGDAPPAEAPPATRRSSVATIRRIRSSGGRLDAADDGGGRADLDREAILATAAGTGPLPARLRVRRSEKTNGAACCGTTIRQSGRSRPGSSTGCPRRSGTAQAGCVNTDNCVLVQHDRQRAVGHLRSGESPTARSCCRMDRTRSSTFGDVDQ